LTTTTKLGQFEAGYAVDAIAGFGGSSDIGLLSRNI
jgi:hypothetical protein